MKKRIMSALISSVSAFALAVSASAATLAPTGNPTTIDFSQEEISGGEVWIHAVNIWNDASMFTLTEIEDDAKDIIVSFDVNGCDGTYNMLVGFQINDGIYGWNIGNYEEFLGSIPEYVIDHDGSYEFIVPTNLFMKAESYEDPETGEELYYENITSVQAVEPWVYNLGESSSMTVTIKDIKLSSTAHALAEVSNASDNGAAAATVAAEEAQTPSVTTAAAASNANPSTGPEGLTFFTGLAALSAAAAVCFRKRS